MFEHWNGWGDEGQVGSVSDGKLRGGRDIMSRESRAIRNESFFERRWRVEDTGSEVGQIESHQS